MPGILYVVNKINLLLIKKFSPLAVTESLAQSHGLTSAADVEGMAAVVRRKYFGGRIRFNLLHVIKLADRIVRNIFLSLWDFWESFGLTLFHRLN